MKKLLAVLLACALGSTTVCAAAEPTMLVRAGGSFCLALDQKGQIWGWGDNSSGQVGNGNNKRVYMPAPAASGLDGNAVRDIECGNVNTLFLMRDGTVFTCGNNNYGQQGSREAGSHVFTPVQVPGLSGIVQVACGFGQCLALTGDGRVYAWGRNSNGQIGDGTHDGAPAPVELPLTDIACVQCGGKFCLALGKDGAIWGWGDNEFGQLGEDLPHRDVKAPTKLSVSGRFQQIACGGDISFGVTAEGELWAWGRNDYWQLGTDEVLKQTDAPVRVKLPSGVMVREIYAYNSHTAAITDTGALWQWGGIFHGQVGNGKRPWRGLPSVACPDSGVAGVAVGSLQSCLLLADGTVKGAGCNEYGQTGAYHSMRYYVATWMNTGLNLVAGAWSDPGND